MSMLGSARRRLRADRQVLAHRLVEAAASRAVVGRELAKIKPAWFVGGGLLAGVLVGGMPARVIGGIIGGIAAFSLRLMSTPLGPAAFGAIMARRTKGGRHEHRVSSGVSPR